MHTEGFSELQGLPNIGLSMLMSLPFYDKNQKYFFLKGVESISVSPYG